MTLTKQRVEGDGLKEWKQISFIFSVQASRGIIVPGLSLIGFSEEEEVVWLKGHQSAFVGYLRILRRSFWCSLRTWFARGSPPFAAVDPHGPFAAVTAEQHKISFSDLKASVNAHTSFFPFIPPSIDSLVRKKEKDNRGRGANNGLWGHVVPAL